MSLSVLCGPRSWYSACRTEDLVNVPFPLPFVLQGDLEGPLICDGMLQGIPAGGHVPCDSPSMPSVYIKVMPYLQWIKETMLDNS